MVHLVGAEVRGRQLEGTILREVREGGTRVAHLHLEEVAFVVVEFMQVLQALLYLLLAGLFARLSSRKVVI